MKKIEITYYCDPCKKEGEENLSNVHYHTPEGKQIDVCYRHEGVAQEEGFITFSTPQE